MTIRLKVILAMLIGTVLLLIVLVSFQAVRFFQAKPASVSNAPVIENAIQNGTEPVVSDQTNTQPIANVNTAPQTPPAAIPLKEPERKDEMTSKLVAITLPFVERYGTFSNQNNFENIKDLFPYMTENLKKKSQRMIDESAGKPFQKSYTGTVTKALSYKVGSIDETGGNAALTVTTQRQEYVGTPSNYKVFTQDLSITFKKEDSVWLVDSVTWL